jgi:SAM-dependent methyltransferase
VSAAMHTTAAVSTREIYDAHAASWGRQDRLLLSDFTARPHLIAALGDLAGARLLDLGCGEGYVARLAAQAGAAYVEGYDISGGMVEAANEAVPAAMKERLIFRQADATSLDFEGRDFSHAMAVFLFNYLTREEMVQVLRKVRGALRPGGVFAITVPHPCYSFMRAPQAPFYFDLAGKDYFSAVDHACEGEIWRRDGQAVPVRMVHKTFTDYFAAFAAAGWNKAPLVRELHASAEDHVVDPQFFAPLEGYPLHVLFRLEV